MKMETNGGGEAQDTAGSPGKYYLQTPSSAPSSGLLPFEEYETMKP